MSETSDEEVDYGSPEIDAIPHTDSDHAWSTHMEMIVKTKWQGQDILITKITIVEISLQYMKEAKFEVL